MLNRLFLASHEVTVAVVPDLGGKISSINWAGQELLFQNPGRALESANYGASYADFDASGFDECFPSIGACIFPADPWSDLSIPDHGELWSIPWTAQKTETEIHLSVDGVQFPYSLTKSIEIVPGPGLSIRYQLSNKSDHPFPYIWSAHPLLAIVPGSRIHLPDPPGVIVDWSRDERLGRPTTMHDWPLTKDRQGHPIDLSLIGEPRLGYVEKLYTGRLEEGWCGVHHPSIGVWVAMVFPVEKVPYVGCSINQGGWPIEGDGYFNLGLEPCHGCPDRLDIAFSRGSHALLPPRQSMQWQLGLYFGKAAEFPVYHVRSLAAQGLAA